jgi:hypothetical protein
MTGCGSGSGDAADRAEQEERLLSARRTVTAELTSLLGELTTALPGRLAFSQGNYDACRNDLDGPTAYRYRINGRLDLDREGGAAELETVATTLERAGYAVTTPSGTSSEGTRDDLRFSASTVPGQRFLLFSGEAEGCYEIGPAKARRYDVDRDPITIG